MKFIDYINTKEIIDKYNITKVNKLYGGLINDVYKIETLSGIYIAKVICDYYKKNIDRYENTEKISNKCFDNGINVSNALKINDSYVQKVGEDIVLIFKYIDGITLKEDEIKDEHVIKIANLIGSIHKIKYEDNYNKIIRHEIDFSKFIKEDLFNIRKYKDIYLDNYERLTNIFKKVIDIKNSIIPTLGICHRDIKVSNVIWKENEPYLIDFESSRCDDIKIDFIETMLRWSGITTFNIDYNKMKLFINEYNKYIDTSNYNYKELLIANLLSRFDFLYYNLEITLLDISDDLEKVNQAENQVIQMINEINYYYDNINNIINMI